MLTKPRALTLATAALGTCAVGLLLVRNPKMISGIATSYGWKLAYCYLNDRGLILLHASTDSVIFLSYVAISVVLAYLVYRTRRELPFSWMVLAFGTFIIACGFTHLMEVIVLWRPLYWLSGDVKLITAIASLITAVTLPPLVPKIEAMIRAARLSERRYKSLQVEANKLVHTEEMLRRLSRRVLTLQDDERRRLGRELHDSAGQLLAAIRLNLGIVSQWTNTDPRTSAKLADTATLADQAIAEIRTLSYLLHPPMLDETGLAGAVEWYVHGFGERSKITVTLEVDPGLGRFHRDVETAIFRIIQECLVNIHRHSGSPKAFISLQSTSSGISLTIRDEGRGISLRTLREEGGDLGVGIRGMRERARQLGGSLDIQSVNPGTLVAVTLPAIKAAPTGHIALGEAAG